jgi:hypothetical protein
MTQLIDTYDHAAVTEETRSSKPGRTASRA